MTDFVKKFWQWLVAFAVVGGLYLAADAVHKIWAFLTAVGAAVILAAISKLRPTVKSMYHRLRDYPNIEAQLKVRETEIEGLRREVELEREKAGTERRNGLREGRKEAAGVVFAHLVQVPQLSGVTMRQGQLLLTATAADSPPEVGARYYVEATTTNEIKGTVQVQTVNRSQQIVFLECIDTRVVEFWQQLEANAEVNATIPADIRLIKFALPPIQEAESGRPDAQILKVR